MIKYESIELKQWQIFSAVPDSSLIDVVLVHIFGVQAESAFFVNSADEVYAIGANVYGRLGIGDVSSEKPVLMKELCGLMVKSFATGTIHGLALAGNGSVYAWGNNHLGRLGTGSTKNEDFPTLVKFPTKVEVTQIACTDRYCLALTSGFQIYHWGDILFESDVEQRSPILVAIPSEYTIIRISCGTLHAAAVTECGKVLTWGVNECGQLGLGHENIQRNPSIVGGQLADQNIVSVACGRAATLVLTSEGVMYAWGLNRMNCLCVGMDSEFVVYPQRVIFRKNVTHIASNNCQSIFCFVGINPHGIYQWIHDEMENEPIMMKKCNNILEGFYGFSLPVIERMKEFSLYKIIQGPVRDIGKSLFNNPEYSDLKVLLSDGGIIYVHSLIMRVYSAHFRTLLGESWSNPGSDTIEMKDYNPNAYTAFLKYIYTGSIYSMGGRDIIDLYNIADSYFETDLKELCVKMFQNCLKTSNLAELYEVAMDYKCTDIERVCVEFFSNNVEEVVLSPGFQELNPSYVKALITTGIKYKRFQHY